MQSEILALFARLKSGNSLPSDFADLSAVTFDVKTEWVDAMFAKQTLHDPDFAVFSHFRDPDEWLLDVGANRGYSVASMRLSGSTARIMSFEVGEAFRPSLARVKEREGDRYDFRIIGVARSPGTLKFHAPVVNGLVLSALTTAEVEGIDPASFASNIISYIEDWTKPAANYEIKLCRFEAAVDRLDALVPSDRRVAAAKLDIEGLEHEAIEGGRRLLEVNRPFLMVEGGHRDPRIVSLLAGIGYERAVRRNDQLKPGATDPAALNGFFLPAERIDKFRSLGLVVD